MKVYDMPIEESPFQAPKGSHAPKDKGRWYRVFQRLHDRPNTWFLLAEGIRPGYFVPCQHHHIDLPAGRYQVTVRKMRPNGQVSLGRVGYMYARYLTADFPPQMGEFSR